LTWPNTTPLPPFWFDEFEPLDPQETVGESDASRRLKSELLQQVDGILSYTNQQPILILTATNMPWYKNAQQ